MGGRNGFGPADYAALSDRQIVAILQIEWDDEGRLVTESEAGGEEETGSLARAGRELQSPEQLGISEAELQWALAIRPMVDVCYLSMFWSVWQHRGKTNEEIRRLWAAHLASDR